MKSWNNVSTHIALFGWNSVDITSILPRVLKTLSGELSYYSVIQIKQCCAICDRRPLSVLWYLFLNAQNLHIEKIEPCLVSIWFGYLVYMFTLTMKFIFKQHLHNMMQGYMKYSMHWNTTNLCCLHVTMLCCYITVISLYL